MKEIYCFDLNFMCSSCSNLNLVNIGSGTWDKALQEIKNYLGIYAYIYIYKYVCACACACACAFVRHQALMGHINVCRQFGTKPLSNLMYRNYHYFNMCVFRFLLGFLARKRDFHSRKCFDVILLSTAILSGKEAINGVKWIIQVRK